MNTFNAYRQKRLILFLAISVGYLVVFFQRVAPAIVGPVMAEELGLAATDLGIMASMYFWAQAAGCIPAGLFSDTLFRQASFPIPLDRAKSSPWA